MRVSKSTNFSKAAEAGEEGVGVARAFAAVHYLDAPGPKASPLRQGQQPLAQAALGERGELVEERQDQDGGQQGDQQLKARRAPQAQSHQAGPIHSTSLSTSQSSG